MKYAAQRVMAGCFVLAGYILCVSGLVEAQVNDFKHIVVIVQENRTPDNLFQGLCLPPYGNAIACGPGSNQYDIQNSGVDEKGNKVMLAEVPLGNTFNPGHTHSDFNLLCDLDPLTNQCTMSGLSSNNCPTNCSFEYVHPADVHEYLTLAQQYGWANSMFQTNQGPSEPAHQFLFGGTSAGTLADDAQARFLAENGNNRGCLSPLSSTFMFIDPQHLGEFEVVNNPLGTVCSSKATMATLLDAQVPAITWKYYSAGSGLWTAPNFIRQICQPNSGYTRCTGSEWKTNVDLQPADVLKDIASCQLPEVTWVTPSGQNSDHPSTTTPSTGGPAWVASIVNAIGNSWKKSGNRCDYWGHHTHDETAIVITWDDWGGFYDHRPPTLLSKPDQGQGDYQYGFRVPLVFVSAFTNPMIDSVNHYDFGSILRLIERNYGMTEGALGTADARAQTDLTGFYNLSLPPRKFSTIASPLGAYFFIHDKRPMEPPDED